MKDVETPKKSAPRKQNTAPKSAPHTGSAAKKQTAPKKNAPPPEKKGLSFMTVLLILLTIGVAAFLIWFCFDKFLPKEESTTQSAPATEVIPSAPITSPAETLVPTPTPPLPVTPTPSESMSPTPTPSVMPTPSVEPTPSVMPSPSLPNNDPDTARVFVKPGVSEERIFLTVNEGTSEEGTACIRYTAPYLTVPYSEEVEQTVNDTVIKTMQSVRTKLEKNIKGNYKPPVHSDFYEIMVHSSFFRSKNSFSIVLRYQTLAGNGETIDEVSTVTFDAATGKRLTLDDVLRDKSAMAAHLLNVLPPKEDRDVRFVEAYICSGFYFDGQKMVLLYNGKKLYTTDPTEQKISVTNQNLFTGN